MCTAKLSTTSSASYGRRRLIELLWNNPIGEARMSKYIAALDVSPGQEVLDVGCGCGEALIRILERYDAGGLGIDKSEPHIEEARRRAAGRLSSPGDADRVEFQVDDAEFASFGKTFDLVVNVGATHAFGCGADAYDNALQRINAVLKPGGMALIGEGYMKRPATPQYRRLLGEDMPDHMTHAHNVSTATKRGYRPVAAWTSSVEEWDDFEWGYQRIIERRATQEKTSQDQLQRRRQWMDAYLKWGRETLGFGVYLLRKEA